MKPLGIPDILWFCKFIAAHNGTDTDLTKLGDDPYKQAQHLLAIYETFGLEHLADVLDQPTKEKVCQFFIGYKAGVLTKVAAITVAGMPPPDPPPNISDIIKNRP